MQRQRLGLPAATLDRFGSFADRRRAEWERRGYTPM
jgi:hypothetical protein